MPDVVVIQEDVPSGLRVELRDADTPHARPRATPAFESGGPVEREKIYLPGRTRPILQIQQPRERDLVIKGAFRDHLHAQDGGTDARHAKQMRDRLETIRRRCNVVLVTWDGEQRVCFLAETKFGEESAFEKTYELTFDVLDAGAPGADVAAAARRAPGTEADLATQARALVAELRANLARARAALAARQLVDQLENGLDLADAALGDLQTAAEALQGADPKNVFAAVARATGAGRLAHTAATAVQLVARATGAASAVPTNDPDFVVAWWQLQFGVDDTMNIVIDLVRECRAQALARARQATRLYLVQPGDTLETIARNALGSAARAGELGLRPEDLVPGTYVRIPEAA